MRCRSRVCGWIVELWQSGKRQDARNEVQVVRRRDHSKLMELPLRRVGSFCSVAAPSRFPVRMLFVD